MIDKILKLAGFARKENTDIYDRLIALAEDIEGKMPSQKEYLLIDIKEMESLIDSEKVEEYKGIGKVELDL
mgnify:CR=1|tara:strand:+ start:1206 stop:1418 length:213 start_codon:yes stop_codon:yes gene_type:complete